MILEGHLMSVRSISFSPDGKRIASGSEDGTIRVWDIQQNKDTGSKDDQWNQEDYYLVKFQDDGKQILIKDNKGETQTVDTESGNMISTEGNQVEQNFSIFNIFQQESQNNVDKKSKCIAIIRALPNSLTIKNIIGVDTIIGLKNKGLKEMLKQ